MALGSSPLHRTEEGPEDGLALVLLHGFTGTARDLLRASEGMDAVRRIGVDLPGHGRSEPPGDPARAFERCTEELASLCGDHRVDLWGYSMGGRIALSLALRLGKRLGALVLESASPGLDSEEERAARRAEDEALAERIEREGVAAFVAAWEQRPVLAGDWDLPTAQQRELRQERLSQRPGGLAYALRGLGLGAQPSLWARLGEIEAPTLILCGQRDEKFRAIAAQMAARLPRARVAEVSGAGHAPHRERAAQTRGLVQGFLGVSQQGAKHEPQLETGR